MRSVNDTISYAQVTGDDDTSVGCSSSLRVFDTSQESDPQGLSSPPSSCCLFQRKKSSHGWSADECAVPESSLYKTVTAEGGWTERICTLCPYRTSSVANIEKHVKTHSGNKPYACNVCPYRAIQLNNLTAHMRTHTGEKPFPCPLCPYRASRSNTLTAHIFRRHNNDPRTSISN